MQISRDFTVCVHILLCVEYFKDKQKTTSDFIASSVGVNPVIIRQLLQKLKAAGLVEVKAGTGGAFLLKPPDSVSLYDIYKAAGCDKRALFNFHENPNPSCPVGSKIHIILDGRIAQLTEVLEAKMKCMKLSELLHDMKKSTSV